MDDLPSTWTISKLSDLLVSLESGSRPRGGVRGISSGIPSIGGEHLTSIGTFDFSNIKYVPEPFAERMSKGHIQPNDILIVKDGATTGKISLVGIDFPYRNAVVNEHVFICRPKPHIEPKYLFRFLFSLDGQQQILDNFKGSAQGGINLSFVNNVAVPIAPLPEQRRVVEKLEQLLAKVTTCRQRLDKIPTILKRFRQSILHTAFSKNNHVSGKMAEIIKDGPQNGLYKPQNAYGNGTLIVRIDNFYGGIIEPWDNLQRLSLSDKERQLYSLRNGDLLINRVNSMKYLGKSALVRRLIEPCVFESNIMRIGLNHKFVEPEYVVLYLQCPQGIVELRKNAKHAVNQSSINQQDVKSCSIPLPPLPEQRESIRRVEALFKIADGIQARYEKARAQVDKLTQAILAKAFRGELVRPLLNSENG